MDNPEGENFDFPVHKCGAIIKSNTPETKAQSSSQRQPQHQPHPSSSTGPNNRARQDLDQSLDVGEEVSEVPTGPDVIEGKKVEGAKEQLDTKQTQADSRV